MELYNRIRTDNRVKYGTQAEKILGIIINQYSDRTHFIYEIIQNAEDAGASQIRFHLTHRYLEIYHDGRPFDPNDIEGVCGIANGTKEDGTRIGHFGIGFKSVYCYTETPEIYSGKYHFVIKSQLFPEEIAGRVGLADRITCMILPFNKESVPCNVAYSEIKDALVNKINAESILILDNIDLFTIQIDDYDKEISIQKTKNQKGRLDEGCVYALSMSTAIKATSGRKNINQTDYLFFCDEKAEAAALIFRVGGKSGKELLPIRNAKIYAYFPTAKEAHQNFFIHAPFDTTPARDNFKEGADYGRHNVHLVANICDLIVNSILWMRDNGYLSIASLNTVLPVYEYEKTDVLYPIYENSIDLIANGEEILPTNTPGVFKAIEDICIPASANIIDTFSNEDLQQLIGFRFHWIAKEIMSETYIGLRRFLQKNATFRTVDWRNLVTALTANFLQLKSAVWFENLFDRIGNYCINHGPSDHNYINVSRIPFVRIESGQQICAKDESGKPLVYLNNDKAANYRISREFLSNSTIKRFYFNVLGIVNYDIEQEVRSTILPKYASSCVAFNTDNHIRENIEDLKAIKDAIAANAMVLKEIQDKYIVTDGQAWYKPASLYIPGNDIRTGYSLMRGVVSFKYLADAYFEGTASLKLDVAFFRDIGCHSGIRELSVSESVYLGNVKKYCHAKAEDELWQRIFSKAYQSRKFNWAFNYEGFPEIFQGMSLEKSIKIAKFLNAKYMDYEISGEIVAADDKQFSGRNVDNVIAYSMLGLQICFEKWIYVKGQDEPQRPVDVYQSDIVDQYLQYPRLLTKLPFKTVQDALSQWLSSNNVNSTNIELVHKYFSNPDALIKAAQNQARKEAKDEAKKNKGSTIEELIRSGDKSQQTGHQPENGIEVNPISEKALDKREKYLEDELAKSMDQVVRVAKNLRFTRQSCNAKERKFLEAEYNGTCQICEKAAILKYDGSLYFEAINIIKFSDMLESSSNSSDLGWNSLCLCPNCAAEYNYCSKKISTLYNQVMAITVEPDEDEPITIHIEMPEGTPKRILYSPRHFLALKKAFEIFTKAE